MPSRDTDLRSNIQAIILMKFLGTHRGLQISILYKKRVSSPCEALLRRMPPTMRRYILFYFSSVQERGQSGIRRGKKREYHEIEKLDGRERTATDKNSRGIIGIFRRDKRASRVDVRVSSKRGLCNRSATSVFKWRTQNGNRHQTVILSESIV